MALRELASIMIGARRMDTVISFKANLLKTLHIFCVGAARLH